MKLATTTALFMTAIAPMLAAIADPFEDTKPEPIADPFGTIPETPCAIVDCQPGFSMFGQDKRGCGGHCIQMSAPLMKSALAAFTANDINADGSITPGAAYSALSQVASRSHVSPTEKQLNSFSKTKGKTVTRAEFLQMCIKMMNVRVLVTTRVRGRRV